jgi:hypothetical protein
MFRRFRGRFVEMYVKGKRPSQEAKDIAWEKLSAAGWSHPQSIGAELETMKDGSEVWRIQVVAVPPERSTVQAEVEDED